MTDSDNGRLRETSWRRALTPAEEKHLREWLSIHPEDSHDWELEQKLTGVLGQLPNAPLPSNFTARVVQEAQRGTNKTPTSSYWWRWRWQPQWMARVGLAAAILAAGLFSYEHLQTSKRRDRAESVREMVSFTAVPGPEILQDYDAIQAMSLSPVADVELLKALQ